MRDIFQEVFEAPTDPTEAARIAMRPNLRKRFYARADVRETADGFVIVLDDRPVRTPAQQPLAAPSRALAEAIAAEWQAQGEVIDPGRMPLTRLANTVIDGVAGRRDEVAAEIEKYLRSDLLFYRAEGPEGLVRRQSLAWDPVLAWARDQLSARFVLTEGVKFVDQPEHAVTAARSAIPRDHWRLGAVSSITSLTGSALLALALLHDALSVDEAWRAAHVDEDWNIQQWGRDEIAMARRDFRFAELRAAAEVLRRLG
jgi:chaperone required for assembly of F1-ATPase